MSCLSQRAPLSTRCHKHVHQLSASCVTPRESHFPAMLLHMHHSARGHHSASSHHVRTITALRQRVPSMVCLQMCESDSATCNIMLGCILLIDCHRPFSSHTLPLLFLPVVSSHMLVCMACGPPVSRCSNLVRRLAAARTGSPLRQQLLHLRHRTWPAAMPLGAASSGQPRRRWHRWQRWYGSYLADLDTAWQKVNDHPVFHDLPRLQTQPMGMAGFDIRQFTESMATHGSYTCGGNLFWADPFYTSTPGVPINRRGAPLLSKCACFSAARIVVSPGSTLVFVPMPCDS
jgi:hypothetical protein